MDKCVVSRHEYCKLFEVVLPESYLLLILDESPSVEPKEKACFYFLISIVQSEGRQSCCNYPQPSQ